MQLVSIPTAHSIQVDGLQEAAWKKATPLVVKVNELPYEPNNGYDGLKETDVEIRSLYDKENIYFSLRWYDPTKSLARFPWEKNGDGSWKQLSNKDNTLHENTYYEDKLAIYWNINEKGFIKKGCDKSCHMVENGLLEGVKDDSAGRHFTRGADETIDEWHWKSVRTNPNKQMDDGYVDNEHETNKKWGRKIDSTEGGGYYNNKNDSPFPAWMNPSVLAVKPYWVFDKTKIAFEDHYKKGDRIGGVVVSPFKGSRGDVIAKGEWKDDHWQLEIKRKRVTNHEKTNDKVLLNNGAKQDLQFAQLDKAYYFGLTVFDNSQINHIYHKKSIKLTFLQ